MTDLGYPNYGTGSGYMTDSIRRKYIDYAGTCGLLPTDAHRMAAVLTLDASNDRTKPIQFWQLYSVLGSQRIVNIVSRFYDKVFADERWFVSVFERVASKERHVLTQSAMWIDAMGGGRQYHGGEFRLNLHHTHNAMELMNARGAARWVELMKATLDESQHDLTDDVRVRTAVNTILSFFMDKYADDFKFDNNFLFGDTNQALKGRINFLKMSTEQVENLSEAQLRDELAARNIDVGLLTDKQALVNKALSL